MPKSKITRHTVLGAFLEVECRKSAVVAQSEFPSQNVKGTLIYKKQKNGDFMMIWYKEVAHGTC